MCSGITTLARIGKRKELKFVNLTYEEIRNLYSRRANILNTPMAFIEKDIGGNDNENYRIESSEY